MRRAPGVLITEIDRAAKVGLTRIKRSAQQRHRFKRKSGSLERSVKVDYKTMRRPGGGIHLDKGVAPYASHVHQGTRPHIIRKKHAKALRWVGKGGFRFAKQVRHPGTRPDQFLYQAARRGRAKLRDEIIKGIVRGLKIVGLK
jgi:hypothetical protein